MEIKIWRITLDTNPEDCNLHCIMCEEHSSWSKFKKELLRKTGVSRRRMPKVVIEKVINETAVLGVKEIIPTTMGDPLVSDSFEYIVRLASEKGMKINITHNGTFPGKSIEDWARIIVPITTDIKISWNGATADTAEKIMKGLNFKKTLEKLKEFIGFRDRWYEQHGHYCRVTFQLTFMRNNMNEIPQIIELASELGVDRIKGHHLWVHFAELEPLSFLQNEDTIKEWNQVVKLAEASVVEANKKNETTILLENFIPLEPNRSKEIPDYYECPFLGNELWISATGKISPCCAPDNERQKLGDFGNIERTSLSKMISSQKYQHFVSNYKNHEICRKCSLRRPMVN